MKSIIQTECEVVIEFIVPKEKIDLLYDATKALSKLGVTFDTGGCLDEDDNICYNWEFDWSLKGPAKVYFKKVKYPDLGSVQGKIIEDSK